jgi:hypothetical protein
MKVHDGRERVEHAADGMACHFGTHGEACSIGVVPDEQTILKSEERIALQMIGALRSAHARA